MTGNPGSGPFAPLDLSATTVRAAHPVTAMLALVMRRLARTHTVTGAFATVLQPASENGAAVLDELHQQTVNLLSFQNVPKEQFDTQAAFNLLSRFGDDAKAQLATTRKRVDAELRSLLDPSATLPAMQWLQAPVFHGFGVSLFVQLEGVVAAPDVETALAGELIDLVTAEGEPPSNLTAAGQGNVLVQVRSEAAAQGVSTLALWMAADNLKLTAQTAVACAVELTRLQPLGKVQ